ncbi:aminoglycoside phosphotransferase family protein [Rhodococcus sovatensis]|uniref:Aminoglycoside phosphotransferase family protein n=1 Tax=Rhodococcus sovatensis TaxID=1805840 RepID=A0ABZ2PNQ2_9NOCA
MIVTGTVPEQLSHDVSEHLAARGLVPVGTGLELTSLAGGVSNDVIAVSGPGIDVVVKRALSTLRVEELWNADPKRLQVEGRALQLAGTMLPAVTPRVLDLDDEFLVIERSPRDWYEWRTELISGVADTRVARELGHSLGIWQFNTTATPSLVEAFLDRDSFHQLRVQPFHETVLARHADLSEAIRQTIEVMLSRQTCLVHGDFTPKNILVEPPTAPICERRLWVLDWEVAHVGDEDFDAASLLAHLLIKSVHQPKMSSALFDCARAFVKSWQSHIEISSDQSHLVRQIGCMLLARVDGKSPVGYLDRNGQHKIRQIGRLLLQKPGTTIAQLWEMTK